MISIIVPVYNAAQYIERCVCSVVNQSYGDWELILVNDGSTDQSEQIIKSLIENDSRIKYYYKNNGGVSSARNWGIRHANGDFLLFVDSDDWLAYNTCEVLIKNINKSQGDCVIFGFNQTHGHVWAPEKDKEYSSLSELKRDFDYWLNTELLSSSVNKLYRKSVLCDTFNEKVSFGEDLIFSLGYLSHCSVISFIATPLYQHEVYNATSITHSFNPRRLCEIEYMQAKVLEFAEEITDDTYRKYYNDIIRHIKMLFRQKSIIKADKCEIAEQWLGKSYYKGLSIRVYNTNAVDYIYAKLIQLGCWGTLCFLHAVKQLINQII